MNDLCRARRTPARFFALIALAFPPLASAGTVVLPAGAGRARAWAAPQLPPPGLSAFSAPMGAAALPPALAAPAVAAAPLPAPAALTVAQAAPAAAPAKPAEPKRAKSPAKRSALSAAKARRIEEALSRDVSAPEKKSMLGELFDGSTLAPENDVTAEYHALMDRPMGSSLRAADSLGIRELRKHKVVLVPGFLSGAFIRLGSRTFWPGRRYFGDQIDWLNRMGVEYEMADVHTVQTVEENAPVVARAIENTSKPVLVVTHSMGGRILLEALIKRPDLRARVHGWIPVQAPFLGSHIAGLPAIGGLSHLLRLFGGTKETVLAMTPERSREYYRRHRSEIDAVLRAVHTVAFASWVNTNAPRWLILANPVLKWVWDAISRRGGRNDILVPAASAVLPGMAYVAVAGIDHLTPFVDAQLPFDRVRFLKTLLSMVLRRAAAP